MIRDDFKRTLDVLSEWKCPEGIYYVLGYAPFSSPGNPDFEGGKCVISFGLSPHFGDTGITWDVELGPVPTVESLQKIEAALIGKLVLLPMLEAQRASQEAGEPTNEQG